MTATLTLRMAPGTITRSRRVSETSKFCRSLLWFAERWLLSPSAPTSPSGRLLATVTPGALPEAFSVLCSVSELIATRLSGSMMRSVIVWLSISASTLTSTMALPCPTRALSRRWKRLLARIASARALGLAAPPVSGVLLAGEDHPGGGVDDRHRVGRDAGDGGGDEVADRLRLAARQRPARHGDGDRGRACGRAGEGLRHRVGEMHPRRAHVGRAGDGAGKLALLGAPVGGVEHLALRAEPREPVENLVAGRPARRQVLGGELHPDPVACRGVDHDRRAVHLERHALGLVATTSPAAVASRPE